MEKNYLTADYKYYENERTECALFGIIALIDGDRVSYDVLDIAVRFCKGRLDFDNLVGFFRMVVYDKKSGRQYYFCDNAGAMRFFVDKKTNTVHDSFMSAVKNRNGDIAPCYGAIAQKFAWLRCMDDTTIVEGIIKLGAHFYYEQDWDKLTEHHKGLRTFAEYPTNIDAKRITDILYGAIKDEKIGAVATGGADSRVVLSYLYNLGARPQLIITGRDDNPDVRIAQIIADTLNLPLATYNPDDIEDDWIERGFAACDGLCEAVEFYRHLRKTELSNRIGYHFEFGGVGGEYYKNFYPRYRRRGNIFCSKPEKAFKSICKPMTMSAWMGDAVKAQSDKISGYVLDYMTYSTGESEKQAMNNSGNFYLMGVVSDIANPISLSVLKLDPLTDRHSIAAALNERMSPYYALCMWNRREVAKYCPELSDIPRDVGQTLSVDKKVIRKERFALRKLLFRRFIAKLKGKPLNLSAKYWESDHSRSKKTKQFEEALVACKRIGVVSENATADSITTSLAGHILTIGLLFSRYSKEV